MTEKNSRICFIFIALCLLLLVFSVLIMAAVPPVTRDALTHHLAVPKLWIKNGGMYEIPQITFSYYPMNLDLIYVIPLIIGNDIVPKYIHLLFGIATALSIYTFLKKRTTLAYALLGALIFLSTPVIVKLSISVYVDLGLIFFSWVSIYYIFEWDRSFFQMKKLLLAAVCCGIGIGTKYNGLLVLFLLTLSVQFIYLRNFKTAPFLTSPKTLLPAVIFFSVAMTIFSPWMIKNLKWTGNPVYPLYNHLFTRESGSERHLNKTMKPWLQRKLIYHETAIETTLIPARIFFQGQDDNPKYFDGKLNPILFFFPLLSFIRFKTLDIHSKSELIVMGCFAILYLLYASFIVDMRVRYISPILPPLVIMTVYGIKNAFFLVGDRIKVKKNILKIFLLLIISILLLQNILYLKNLFLTVDPISYLNGSIDRDDYIERFRPEYPVVQVANHLSNENVKIIALFLGNRRYYFDKEVAFSSETFKNAVERSTPDKSIVTELSTAGFTHVIVNVGLFKTWAKSVFHNEQLIKINTFFDTNSKFIYAKNGYYLYEILNKNIEKLR